MREHLDNGVAETLSPLTTSEPYAATRLDALRQLRREGYAVVHIDALEDLRKRANQSEGEAVHQTIDAVIGRKP